VRPLLTVYPAAPRRRRTGAKRRAEPPARSGGLGRALARALRRGTRQLLARGARGARPGVLLADRGRSDFVARRPDGGTVEMWTRTAPARWASRAGVQDKNVWRVCRGLSAAGGGVAKATQLPLGVRVRYLSRADLSPSFCTCCGPAIGLRLQTALPAGLKQAVCKAAREPGRRLPERLPAAHRPGSHSELRCRAAPAARRRGAAAPDDRIVGTGAPPRPDRAITRRRGRRPRAWGEARGPRTTESRPLRPRARAAA
jgi:hypothetical protein